LVEGTVTKLTKFGAFARLAETDDYEVEGLIHISELSERRVEHPREVVNEGDVLTLRIINVDPERRRIGLSLRKVDSADFADQDWKTAMEEIDVDEQAEEVVDEVEDFDAELEAEDRSTDHVAVADVMELEVEALSPENMPVAEGAEPEPEALSPENMTVAEATEPEPEDPGGGLEN
jgi:ribosomal protein S1